MGDIVKFVGVLISTQIPAKRYSSLPICLRGKLQLQLYLRRLQLQNLKLRLKKHQKRHPNHQPRRRLNPKEAGADLHFQLRRKQREKLRKRHLLVEDVEDQRAARKSEHKEFMEA